MVYDDVVIIGAGQAGLSAGYFLRNTNLSFLIIEQEKRIGDNWRNRYDSLMLFSPRANSFLPGLKLEGDQDWYSSKNEIGDYFEQYTKQFNLPVLLNTKVTNVEKNKNLFLITSQGKKQLIAKHVIVATGPFHTPYIPSIPRKLSKDVIAIHSSEYKNPKQLQPGTTLIVGAGNSGVQIAVAVSREKKQKVFLSYGTKPSLVPARFLGKSLYWWGSKTGLLQLATNAPKNSFLGKLVAKREGNKIIGTELKSAIKKGEITPKQRLVNADGTVVTFADGSALEVNNIIWATGFNQDFSWIKIPEIFDRENNIIHERGITNIPGLYFLGLEWLYTRGSSAFIGVKKDAAYTAQYIKSHTSPQ